MKLPRFSLRDLLWTTFVSALVLGWTLDHWDLARINQGLATEYKDKWDAYAAGVDAGIASYKGTKK